MPAVSLPVHALRQQGIKRPTRPSIWKWVRDDVFQATVIVIDFIALDALSNAIGQMFDVLGYLDAFGLLMLTIDIMLVTALVSLIVINLILVGKRVYQRYQIHQNRTRRW